jgi:hypothetical protein
VLLVPGSNYTVVVLVAVTAEAACKLQPGNNKTTAAARTDASSLENTTASYWPVAVDSSAARHLVISRRRIRLLKLQPGGEG